MPKVTLWMVHDGDELAHMVLARDSDESVRLFVAATGFDDPHQLRVERPKWRPALTPEPSFPARVIGIWSPPAATLAGYGFLPSEDYRECPCCGLILGEEDFEEDADECCGCAGPASVATEGA